jgi:hypothetical protein
MDSYRLTVYKLATHVNYVLGSIQCQQLATHVNYVLGSIQCQQLATHVNYVLSYHFLLGSLEHSINTC